MQFYFQLGNTYKQKYILFFHYLLLSYAIRELILITMRILIRKKGLSTPDPYNHTTIYIDRNHKTSLKVSTGRPNRQIEIINILELRRKVTER